MRNTISAKSIDYEYKRHVPTQGKLTTLPSNYLVQYAQFNSTTRRKRLRQRSEFLMLHPSEVVLVQCFKKWDVPKI
jgi:hypothetical protein